jgi:hypothetical protein
VASLFGPPSPFYDWWMIMVGHLVRMIITDGQVVKQKRRLTWYSSRGPSVSESFVPSSLLSSQNVTIYFS